MGSNPTPSALRTSRGAPQYDLPSVQEEEHDSCARPRQDLAPERERPGHGGCGPAPPPGAVPLPLRNERAGRTNGWVRRAGSSGTSICVGGRGESPLAGGSVEALTARLSMWLARLGTSPSGVGRTTHPGVVSATRTLRTVGGMGRHDRPVREVATDDVPRPPLGERPGSIFGMRRQWRWRRRRPVPCPSGREGRADQRVQLVLPRQARSGRVVAGCAQGSPGDPGVPAGRPRDGDRDHPRGEVRAVRRRHPAGVHHELRRAVGRLHGGLLHLGSDARAVRHHLPPRRRLRRASGPRRGASRSSSAPSRPRRRTPGTTAAR